MPFNNSLLAIMTLLTIFLCIQRDGGHILNNSKLWHSEDAANRVLIGSYISWLNYNSLLFLPLFLASYWILFDAGLNIKRGLPILYVGRTAWLDTFIKSPELMSVIKIIFLIISIILFLLIK